MANTDILINQAEVIANSFGGKAKLADALGHKNRSTVQGWIESGYIRPVHYPDILSAARALNVALGPDDFQILKPSAFEKEAA